MKINLIIASYGGLPKKHAGNKFENNVARLYDNVLFIINS